MDSVLDLQRIEDALGEMNEKLQGPVPTTGMEPVGFKLRKSIRELIKERVEGNGGDDPHPCKDPLWLNMPLGTPSNLQKIDYCNRCAAQSGTNPQLGNFPVSIVNGYWNHSQSIPGTNYCLCCASEETNTSPTGNIEPVDFKLKKKLEELIKRELKIS